MEQITIICTSLAMAISIFAFVHGAVRLLKKGKPLYCQIIMWAVGCYCLQGIEDCVVYICGDFSDTGIVGQIAMCGFVFALLSANYGTIDNIVDDRSQNNEKYRRLALIAPIAYGIASFFAVAHIFPIDNFVACIYGIPFLAMTAASYFNLKHLLLPKDELGILACTRMINIICLIFYAFAMLLIIVYGRVSDTISNILNVIMSVLVLALTLAAEKGEKTWPI